MSFFSLNFRSFFFYRFYLVFTLSFSLSLSLSLISLFPKLLFVHSAHPPHSLCLKRGTVKEGKEEGNFIPSSQSLHPLLDNNDGCCCC